MENEFINFSYLSLSSHSPARAHSSASVSFWEQKREKIDKLKLKFPGKASAHKMTELA